MSQTYKIGNYLLLFFVFSFIALAVISNFTIHTEQQFVYLAKAFLQGELHFLERPGTLEDVVSYKDNYYWPLGPFPAILLMPFVFFFNLIGLFFYQGYLQFFISLAIFYLCYRIALQYKLPSNDSLYLAFAFCFASVYQLIAFIPWVWYFAQAVTVLLMLLAIYEFLNKKRYFIIGLLLAGIFATRFTAGFAVVFFLCAIFFAKDNYRTKAKHAVSLLHPIFLTGVLLLLYNYLRFENVFDNGFMAVFINNLSVQERNELLKNGLFGLKNIPSNLYYYFLKTIDPVLLSFQSSWGNTHMLKQPYFTVNYPGTSFFVVSPIFLYIFKNPIKTKISQYSLIAVMVILIPLMLYFWPGWRQVGPRYILDLQPFMFLLLLEVFKHQKVSTVAKVVICLSACWNIYFLLCVIS